MVSLHKSLLQAVVLVVPCVVVWFSIDRREFDMCCL
jgi:hypothetical protein